MGLLIQEGAIPSPACKPGETMDASLRAKPAQEFNPGPEETKIFVTASGRQLRLHRLACLWPPMANAEFEALKDSIARHGGLRIPIRITAAGEVLDGRHRLAACVELGIEPALEVCDGSESEFVELVIDGNERRRHLSASQRALVAARLANLPPGRPGEKAQIRAVTQRQAAGMFKISRSLIQSAQRVLTHGVADLVRLVDRDQLTVSAAAEIADLDQDEQRNLVQKGSGTIEERLARLRRGENGGQHSDNTQKRENEKREGGMKSARRRRHAATEEAGDGLPGGKSESDGATTSRHGEAAEAQKAVAAANRSEVDEALATDEASVDPWSPEEITETSFPIIKDLTNPQTFVIEARLWFQFEDSLAGARDLQKNDKAIRAILLSKKSQEYRIVRDTSFAFMISELLDAANPRDWTLCKRCKGRGTTIAGECSTCWGTGYLSRPSSP